MAHKEKFRLLDPRGPVGKVIARMTQKTLNITVNDLLRGRPGSTTECPAALAAWRLFPKALTITVAGPFVNVYYKGKRTGRYEVWRGDEPLRQFIAAVDYGTVPQDGVPDRVDPLVQPTRIRLIKAEAY
jgi:hypothetical protein